MSNVILEKKTITLVPLILLIVFVPLSMKEVLYKVVKEICHLEFHLHILINFLDDMVYESL